MVKGAGTLGAVFARVIQIAATALAQEGIGARFLQAEAGKRAGAQKYTWKTRIEVVRRGESRGVQIVLMRYGVDGTIQKTPLGGTPPGERPRGPVMRRVVENKGRETRDLVTDLVALAQSYAPCLRTERRRCSWGRP